MILIWSHIHAFLMVCTVLSIAGGFASNLLPALSTISILTLLITNRKQLTGRFLVIGRANWLSLFRLFSVLLIFINYEDLHQLAPPAVTTLYLLLVLCLDGLDGFLARHYNEAGQLGAYLDMEADALIILHLCLALWLHHEYSSLILIPALLRYGYVLLLLCLIKKPQLEPKRRYASVVAVIFNLGLLINLFNQSVTSQTLLVLTGVLLVLSFLRSFVFQLQAKGWSLGQ